MSAIEWWRCWHGAPLDAKFLAIADLAAVPPALVAALTWTLFDHASRQRQRGSVAGFDFDGFAAFHRVKRIECVRTFEAMAALERPLHDGKMLMSWQVRQPAKVDRTAALRQQRSRERKRTAIPNPKPDLVGDVTLSHAVTSRITPRHADREEQELFSALDLDSAVTPKTIESVYLGSTDSAHAFRTTFVDEGAKERKPGLLRRLLGKAVA